MLITKDTELVALIDGDIIAYLAAALNEGDGPDDLISLVKHKIHEWTTDAHCSSCKVFMSEGRNFRHDVYEPYKQHRKDKPKPSGVDYAKEWMLDHYEQVCSNPELEADDRMGLYATENRSDTEEVRVIVSTDKDMLTVPAWHYNPNKSLFPVQISEEYATLKRYEQWVTGDSSDGYPGIKGVGIKAWEKYLADDEQVVFNDIIEWYESKGFDREFALGQYLCCTIKHHRLPEGHNCTNIKDLDRVC